MRPHHFFSLTCPFVNVTAICLACMVCVEALGQHSHCWHRWQVACTTHALLSPRSRHAACFCACLGNGEVNQEPLMH